MNWKIVKMKYVNGIVVGVKGSNTVILRMPYAKRKKENFVTPFTSTDSLKPTKEMEDKKMEKKKRENIGLCLMGLGLLGLIINLIWFFY